MNALDEDMRNSQRRPSAPPAPLRSRIVNALGLALLAFTMLAGLAQALSAGYGLALVILAAALVQGVACGGMAQVLATLKGYPGKKWFWLGFFLSVPGLIFVHGLPDLEKR
jgi:hypothetical protein